MAWLMTYAALFHYTAASTDASSSDIQPPPFRSPWLAAQRQNREDSCSRCGISASVLRYLWVTPEAHWCRHCLSITVDYATVTRVFCIEGPGDLPYISMTTSQNLQTQYKVLKIDSGCPPPIYSMGGLLLLVTHSSPDLPPPGTDVKGCQVSITTADGSTQTSVTTKSVTCQTSAGDHEEQQQPSSLEELISQTSATSDAMQDETGPPQLSDGLLAEVMSAIPPQPFSPPSPLPPILSPLHSPVETFSHGWQRIPAADGSPSPPVLQKEPVSSPLLMHPDFIDELEILDGWSPPQVPRSPYYSESWKMRSSPCVFMIQTLIFSDFWDFGHGYSLISRRGCQNKVRSFRVIHATIIKIYS
ncbi:hypothetical protein CRENBAI_023111 [Crenichthys baileyi]|uniref:Uncharacterized protein n=1 Tax=Crenichthys baileyi TaxID=28760 RepID=A0AAV9R474_9TELE